MTDRGFSKVPVLEVNGKAMGYNEAVSWIRAEGNHEKQ